MKKLIAACVLNLLFMAFFMAGCSETQHQSADEKLIPFSHGPTAPPAMQGPEKNPF